MGRPGAHHLGVRKNRPGGQGAYRGPARDQTDLPLKLFARGKVRDTYVAGGPPAHGRDRPPLCLRPRAAQRIPERGKVLTQLSIYWFSQTHSSRETTWSPAWCQTFRGAARSAQDLAGRFMIVRKAKRIDFECVVVGTWRQAWKESRNRTRLPARRCPPPSRSERLAYPISRPATKRRPAMTRTSRSPS